jgi:coenzyme Q-binding protein COQ10
MPGASRSIVFNAPMEKVFKVISDYEAYPKFVPKAKSGKVLKREGNLVTVAYELGLGVKDIKYTLKMKEEAPNKVSWTFVEGDFMKKNDGSWVLEPAGEGKVKGTYTVELEVGNIPMLLKAVVNPVMSALVDSDLPNMLNAFKKRVEAA